VHSKVHERLFVSRRVSDEDENSYIFIKYQESQQGLKDHTGVPTLMLKNIISGASRFLEEDYTTNLGKGS